MPNFTPEGNIYIYIYISWLALVFYKCPSALLTCLGSLTLQSTGLPLEIFFLQLLSLYLLLEGLEVNLPMGFAAVHFQGPHTLFGSNQSCQVSLSSLPPKFGAAGLKNARHGTSWLCLLVSPSTLFYF